MKLLFDQNISYKLIKALRDIFPGADHVYLLGLASASDQEIWEYAKKNDYVIVTQDSDFYERSLIYGFPPKVIWLRSGNVSSGHIERLLRKHAQSIKLFEADEVGGCLEIY